MIASIHLHALPFAWPVLWPMLEKAARRTPGITELDVRRTIESGHAQLWAIVENGQPVAAITTEVTLEPETRCRIWLVGGSRMTEWAPTFMAAIEPWARSLGCKAIWGTQSRRGWARIVKFMGGDEFGTLNGIPAWGRRI
jgi:hypothetical protein